MPIKLAEHTYGTHTFMRLQLDSGRVEEISVYWCEDGTKYRTSADHCPENHPAELREEIIAAFNELY